MLAEQIDNLETDYDLISDSHIKQLKRKTVSGVLSYAFRTLFLQGIGVISILLLSAFFEPEDYAIYGFVTQIMMVLVFFSDIGLAASLIQKKEKPSLKDYQTVFTVQQILSWLIVLVIVIVLATGTIQKKTGETGAWILLALAFSFPLASLKTVSSIILERELDFSKLVIPQIFEQLFFHGILIYLAWQDFGAMAYTYAIIIRSIVGTIVMWLIKPWQMALLLNKESFKKLIGFGMKFQLNDFLARIKDQLFYIVLMYFIPIREYGYIQWAKNWSMYPYNLTVQNVMSITFPTFSRLQKNQLLLSKAINKSIFFITLAIFPVLVGMCIFISPLTHVIEPYQKWQPAIWSFILFTFSIAWAALSSPLINTLNAIGKINQSLKLMIIWTILTWILTPILIYFYGFNGVALAAFIISFTSVLSVIFVKKAIKINVFENTWRQLFASLIMVIVALQGFNYWYQNLIMLLLGIIVSSLTYGLSFLIVGREKLFTEIRSLR